jgi:hypothetical protein
MPRIHASKLGIACGATRRLSVAMSSGSCTVLANAPQDEEIGQNVDHIDRLELAGDTCLWGPSAPRVARYTRPACGLIVQPAWRSARGELAIAIAAVLPSKLLRTRRERPSGRAAAK